MCCGTFDSLTWGLGFGVWGLGFGSAERAERSGSVAAKLRKSCSPSKSRLTFAGPRCPWARNKHRHSGPGRAGRLLAENAVLVGLGDGGVAGMEGAGTVMASMMRMDAGRVRLSARSRFSGESWPRVQSWRPGRGHGHRHRCGRSPAEGRFAGDAAEGGLEFSLDGGFAGLNLPAAEVGAVIGQGQLPVLWQAPGWVEIGHMVFRLDNRVLEAGARGMASGWWDILSFPALHSCETANSPMWKWLVQGTNGAARVVMDEPTACASGSENRPRNITNLRPEGFSGRLEEWHPTCLSNPWRGTMHLYGIRVFEQQEITARDYV